MELADRLAMLKLMTALVKTIQGLQKALPIEMAEEKQAAREQINVALDQLGILTSSLEEDVRKAANA